MLERFREKLDMHKHNINISEETDSEVEEPRGEKCRKRATTTRDGKETEGK